MTDEKITRKLGRPKGSGSVFNDSVREAIIDVLKTGGSRNDAADFVGIGRSTLVDEIKRNDTFSAQVLSAEAFGKLKHIRKMANAEDWRASAEFLKMKYPEEFANTRARIDHTSSDGSMKPENKWIIEIKHPDKKPD